MSTVSTAASYDSIPDFGTLYDAVPAYGTRGDVEFYVAEALGQAGSVLEIGCGTGRVLLPMARAGATVVGIDGSTEMLVRCNAKLALEPEAVRSRVRTQLADGRDFTLGTTFPLIIAPFRVFQQLVSIDDQLRFLASVVHHLAPGGRFIFDTFNTSFTHLVQDRTAEQEDTPWLTLPDGRAFRRTMRVVRVRWIEQVSEIELIYHVAPQPGAPATRHVQAFDMRWCLRAELEHLLARSGLHVKAVYGAFDRSPLTDSSPEMVIVAARG